MPSQNHGRGRVELVTVRLTFTNLLTGEDTRAQLKTNDYDCISSDARKRDMWLKRRARVHVSPTFLFFLQIEGIIPPFARNCRGPGSGVQLAG